jgi:hypothetical protein
MPFGSGFAVDPLDHEGRLFFHCSPADTHMILPRESKWQEEGIRKERYKLPFRRGAWLPVRLYDTLSFYG